MAKPRKRIEVYESTKGLFYWHAIDRNNNIVADGAQGYTTASNARRAARKIGASLIFAPVVYIGARHG